MSARGNLHEEAAEWLLRLQARDVSLDETLEWQRWCEADPRHAAAFTRMEQVWNEDWALLAHSSAPATLIRRRRSRVWAAAAVLLVLILGAIGQSWSSGGEHFQSQVGETRHVRLADGTEVILGGDTRMAVRQDHTLRRVTLQRGEAYFAVAADPRRPFTVDAYGTRITALGTEFNVRRSLDRVTVSVTEGKVQVAPPDGFAWIRDAPPAHRPIRVSSGEQTTVSRDRIQEASAIADPSMLTAWKDGQLAFRSEPLRYVLADVNRYAGQRIELGEPGLGELRVTGTVMRDDVDGWIESVANAFELRAIRQPDRIVLARRHR